MKVQVYLLITERCNLLCPHCIRKVKSTGNRDFSLDKLKFLLDRVDDLFKQHTYVISGGEPTLHPHFCEVVQQIIKSEGSVAITTNGANADSFVPLLADAKNINVQVSLDGDRKTHDFIRGVGVFDLAVNSVKDLLASGFRVAVASVVNKINVDSFLQLSEIVSRLHIPSWSLSMEQAFTAEAKSRGLTTSEWNSFVDEIIKIANVPIRIRKQFDFDLFEKMETKLGKERIVRCAIPNCGVGRTKVYIYPDGTVLPCTCLPELAIGNIFTDDTALLRTRFDGIRCEPLENSVCHTCRWNYFCKGGCPGHSLRRTGAIGLGDERCPYVKNGVVFHDAHSLHQSKQLENRNFGAMPTWTTT